MNAAQYTRLGGQITLGCRLEAESLLLFVRDTGIGLTLVKAVVELHGSSIAVRSAGRNQGSTFAVTLPRSVVVVEAPEEPETART